MQPNHGPQSSADAVRRVLTTAGITGAAFTLSAAAALPALACHGGGNSGDKSTQSRQSSHSAKDTGQHESKDSSSRQSSGKDSSSKATKSASHESASHKSEHAKSEHSDKSQGGDKTEGGQTEGHNPPGNNGTVKIHQTAGDSSPHNQPHVTCTFYVSFFGFDRNQTLNISFAGQAPTGKDVAIPNSGPSSLTSTTDAGGAGHDYDGDLGAFNGSNLDLSALGAPAKQGYHIKLDVATAQGGGHKYKVFWFMPCTSTPPTTETPGGSTGGTTGGTTGGSTGGSTGGAIGGSTGGGTATGGTQVLGETFTRGTTSSTSPSTTSVLGESLSRGSSSGLGALPFTGAEVGALSALGLAALGGGAALTVAGRRRKATQRA